MYLNPERFRELFSAWTDVLAAIPPWPLVDRLTAVGDDYLDTGPAYLALERCEQPLQVRLF
jgi:hypothetical protein